MATIRSIKDLQTSKTKWTSLSTDEKKEVKAAGYDNKTWDAQFKTTAPSASPDVSTSTSVLNSQSLATLQKIMTLTGMQGDENERNAAMLELTTGFLQKEGKIRKDIVQDLGQIGAAQRETTKVIADASVETALYGIGFEKVLETVSSLSKEMGRNITITDEDISRTAIFAEAMELSAYEVSQMVKQFDMMNISIEGAIDKGNEMAEVARNMGVNMQGFMAIITANMDMLNTYNFADGVKGFAKMAAQSQRLGISMSTTAALAEKVMDPEGAVELAANLQVIGGAVGDLADPFKLMYMATNDVAGLQNALVNAGKDLVMFNKETGEMSIPPTAQRQMRAMAETLNMSKEEFAQMIKLQSKFDSVVNQLDFSSFTKEMEDSGVGDYISSIAKMGDGGRYQVKVDGDMKFVDTLTPEDMKTLQNEALIDAENKAKSEKEIMVEQLTMLESINNAISGIDAQTFASGLDVIDPGEFQPKVSKAIIDAMDGQLPNMGKTLADFIGKGVQQVFVGNTDTSIDWSKLGDEFASGMGTGLKGFMAGLTTLVQALGDKGIEEIIKDSNFDDYEGNTKDKNDFMLGQGQAKAVITSKGMIIPSPKDTVVGVDLTASPSTPNMGVMNSNTPNNQTITLNTTKIEGSVDLKIDGRNLGKMSGREIVDAIFSNQTNAIVLKEAIASVSTKTAPGNINEMNSPFT